MLDPDPAGFKAFGSGSAVFAGLTTVTVTDRQTTLLGL